MWPEISQLTAGRVAENSTRLDHERRNYGCRNVSSYVEWWAGECKQIAGDDDQQRMTSTCSTLCGTAAPDRGDTCTRNVKPQFLTSKWRRDTLKWQ